MLTAEQRQAAMAFVQSAVADARAAIASQNWWWWEGDAKAQQVGAVSIVETTTLAAMRDLAARATAGGDASHTADELDARLVELGHTAEDSLKAIRGYAADATFDHVVASTVSQTASEAGALAAHAATTVLSAIPIKVWVVLGAA